MFHSFFNYSKLRNQNFFGGVGGGLHYTKIAVDSSRKPVFQAAKHCTEGEITVLGKNFISKET